MIPTVGRMVVLHNHVGLGITSGDLVAAVVTKVFGVSVDTRNGPVMVGVTAFHPDGSVHGLSPVALYESADAGRVSSSYATFATWPERV
jgi:hypothetical protein